MSCSRRLPVLALLLAAAACRSAPPSAVSAHPAPKAPAREPASEPSRLEQLLQSLSIEEKLGQLSQRKGGRSKTPNSLLDAAELERVRRGLVGSYLHVAGSEPLLALQRVAVEESRAHIPLLFAGDVLHGYRTIFPVPLALAASFDPDVTERAARIAAREAAAAGLHWTFAPMLDIARDPRWGRIVEGPGEDPYLASVLAAASVRGLQGHSLRSLDTLLACPKHFVGYGAALGGRDYAGAELSESSLRDVYLPPFQAALQAGALSVMAAFNEINGVPATASGHLLTDVLRAQWGYRGLVVSDWRAVPELLQHGVADSPAVAAELALTAGVDMEMASDLYASELSAKLARGELSRELLDRAVRRVLQVKEALGLFDDPYARLDPARERALLMADEHREAARELARKSVVLLRNEQSLLPLSKATRRLAVIGPFADDGASALGAWRALGRAEETATLLAALREALPSVQISHEPGCATGANDANQLARALRAARAADLAILHVGEAGDESGEARSRASLALSPCQTELTRALLATDKPVVVVLETGRPLVLGALRDARTILLSLHLGSQAGHALADVLLGHVSPAGRLPVSWPRSEGQIPIFYGQRNTGRPAEPELTHDTSRYRDLAITPEFAFGHGLSYTPFGYADLKLAEARVAIDGVLTFELSLENRGALRSDEVVQVYVHDLVASRAPPVRELRAFARVTLAAGERVRLRFEVPAEALGFTRPDGKYVVEPGAFDLLIGASSADIRLQTRFELSGETRVFDLRPIAFAQATTLR